MDKANFILTDQKTIGTQHITLKTDKETITGDTNTNAKGLSHISLLSNTLKHHILKNNRTHKTNAQMTLLNTTHIKHRLEPN